MLRPSPKPVRTRQSPGLLRIGSHAIRHRDLAASEASDCGQTLQSAGWEGVATTIHPSDLSDRTDSSLRHCPRSSLPETARPERHFTAFQPGDATAALVSIPPGCSTLGDCRPPCQGVPDVSGFLPCSRQYSSRCHSENRVAQMMKIMVPMATMPSLVQSHGSEVIGRKLRTTMTGV